MSRHQHKDYSKWLDDYVDGELSPLNSAELEEALDDSPEYAKRLSDLRRLNTRLSEVFLHFAPPEKLAKSIEKGLPDPKRLLDVPLFCEIAVALGFVKQEAVNTALKEQHALRLEGRDELIGAILLRNGAITEGRIKEVITTQGEQGRPQVLGGFEIIEQVGRGGMGVVYRARQVSMSRDIAIKILYPRLAVDKKYVESLLTEAHSVAHLSHPNIISGIDAGEEDGYIYFAMEFIDGPTLRQWLKKNGPMPEEMAIEISLQVADALEYARTQNLIHRDVKPDNIMLDKSGLAKVCDLGLAKRGEGEILADKGEVLGTPHYLSPEQAQAKPDLDTRSDIYSYGATLYHMVTGTTLYSGKNAQEIMSKHVFGEVEPPQERTPELSDGLNAIILKMLAKKREERYHTPADLKRDFEILKTSKQPVALLETLIKEGKLDPSVLLRKKRKPLAFVMLIVFVAIIAFGGLWLAGKISKPTPTPTRKHTVTPTPKKSHKKTPKKIYVDRKKAKAALDALNAVIAKTPDDYAAIISSAASIWDKYVGSPEAFEALVILNDAKEKNEKLADKEFKRMEAEALGKVKGGDYKGALAAFDNIPDNLKLSKKYRQMSSMASRITKEIQAAVEKRLKTANGLLQKNKFLKTEKELNRLLEDVPAEYRRAVLVKLESCVERRNKYAARESKVVLAKTLDMTLAGDFTGARELLGKYMRDPLFEPYKRSFEQSDSYIRPIEYVINGALERLAEMEGKKIPLALNDGKGNRSFKILKVNKDAANIRVLEYAPGMPRFTIQISSIHPISIAQLAKHKFLRTDKPKEKGELLEKIAIFEMFSGEFYEADKDAEQAERFGWQITKYDNIKENYRRVILDRFAVQALEKYLDIVKAGDEEKIIQTGEELLTVYGESAAVAIKYLDIKRRITIAKYTIAGVYDFFKGKIEVLDDERVRFTYDFSSAEQLADFACDTDLWQVKEGELTVGEVPGYRSGLHHFAVFDDDIDLELEYRNDRPNAMCVLLSGAWLGINSHNGHAGIVNEFDNEKLWSAFNVKKTGFAYRMDRFYHKLKFTQNACEAAIICDGNEIINRVIVTRPCSLEIRDLGYAFIRKLTITGKFDPAWLATLKEITGKLREGKIQRGLTQHAYADLYFSRKVSTEIVPTIDVHFAVSPAPKKIKTAVYSVKYEGYIFITEDGEYEFTIHTSALTRARINGAVVFENTHLREKPKPRTPFQVKLKTGLHKFEFFVLNEGLEHQVIKLDFDCSTGSQSRLPAPLLFCDKSKR